MKSSSLFLLFSILLCSFVSAQTVTVTTPISPPLVPGKAPVASGDHSIVNSGKSYPTGDIVGTSDAQVITGKSIDAGQLTGTVPAAQLPALTGDVTSSAGSAATTVTQIQGQAVTGTQGTGSVLFNSGTNLTTGNFATGVVSNDPTLSGNSSTVLPTQSATKTYVDNSSQGLVYKSPALLATTVNITLSGEQTIDGTLTSASPVLVKNQTDTTTNGIYTSAAGAWTRRADANTGALLKNAAILITNGSVNANTTWNCPCSTVTIGSSPIVFVKISGSNTYSASDGIQLTGNQFSVDSTVARLAASQTLTNKSISGSTNTLTNIPNSAFTNPSITIGGQVTPLGGATSNRGNGAQLQLATGSVTTGDCAKFDANGNTVDATFPCGNSNLAVSGSTGSIQTNNGSGNLAAVAAPAGAVVGTTDAQLLTNKSFNITGSTNATSLADFGDRSLSILDFGGVPDWAVTDSTTALVAAETAALANNIHVIRLDCSIVGCGYKIGLHTVPSGLKIFCPGTQTTPPTDGNFTHFPNAIVTTNNGGITLGDGAAEDGCNFFTPQVYTGGAVTDYQSKYARQLGYHGTAINCGSNCGVCNSLFVGQSFAIRDIGQRNAILCNNRIDSQTGMYLHGQRGGGAIYATNNTFASYGTPFATPITPITSFTDNGAGLLHVSYSTCSGGNCPFSGYGLDIINPGSVESAQGGWIATNVTATGADLQGSTSAFLTGFGQTGTTTSGQLYISGLTQNINQIQPGQSVAGSTCIPSGATVQYVWRSYGIVYLDSAHPATCTVTETITIQDDALTQFSISIATINSGGTGCYAIGDILTLVGGTIASGGNAAQIQVDNTDGSCDASSGVITSTEIADPGSYSVLPSPTTNVATTGGGGTGATFNISSTAQTVLYANTRSGPALDATGGELYFNGFHAIDHLTGILGTNLYNSVIQSCAVHDENYIQDSTHLGILLTGVSKQNVIQCNPYYFGGGFVDRSTATSNAGANIFKSSILTAPPAVSGSQSVLFQIESGTPGQSKKINTLLNGVEGSRGVAFISDDSPGTTLMGMQATRATILGQSVNTPVVVSGSANHLASGSLPIAGIANAQQFAPGTVNTNGGQKNLSNVAGIITPYVDSSMVFDTVALTNNRTVTLLTTNVTPGYQITITRKGSSGGFTRNVYQADGTTLIVQIPDNGTATFAYNSTTSLWVQIV